MTIKHLQQSYYRRLESDNMAKSFKNNTPIDKLSGTTPVTTTETEPTAAVEPKNKDDIEYKVNGDIKQKTKNGKYVGRKKTKTEPTKTINIAVPVSVLEKLNTVKVCYGNNLTQYINKLIEKDIEANYDNYKHIADSLNSFK